MSTKEMIVPNVIVSDWKTNKKIKILITTSIKDNIK